MHKRLITIGVLCCLTGVAIGLFMAFNHTPSSQYDLLERMDIRRRCSKITETYQSREYIRTQELIKEMQEKYPDAPETKEIDTKFADVTKLAVKEDVEDSILKLAEKLKKENALADANLDKIDKGTDEKAFKYQELVAAYAKAMRISYGSMYAGVEYTDSHDQVTVYVNDRWDNQTPNNKKNLVRQTVVLWGAMSTYRVMPVNYDRLKIEVVNRNLHEEVASWNGYAGYALQ